MFSQILNSHEVTKNADLASYSVKRYLAGIDAGRRLWREGYQDQKSVQKAFLNYIGKSPYLPGNNRQRISHLFQYQQKPPLLTAMKRYLLNH